ncbi:MAG: substrate-binding domain-containing protein [Vallitaleaceae bacterium]|nr:substrate-binding domain-containing protein [Vallitaleaceae bacterium]
MGQKLFKVVIIMLVLVLVGSLSLGIINFALLNKNVDKGSMIQSSEPPKYHFMVIVDGSNTSYSEEYKKGMLRACEDNSVAVEFWDITGANKMKEILKQVDIAIESRVDGIIVYTYDNVIFEEALSRATEANIPLVTVNEDVPGSKRVTHVGINKFYIGSEIGRLLNKELIGTGDVIVLERDAFISEDYSSEALEATENSSDNGLIFLGIKDTLRDYGNINVEQVNYSDASVLTAEEVAMNVLEQYENVKAIVCTNGQDTLGVVEVLIDFNKISTIVVIAYDDLPEILDYIDKEVIYATVVADYDKEGYDSVQSLVDYIDQDIVATYSYIPTTIVTKNNLERYKGETNEANEKN